jgi:type II secretion system protein H
VSRQVAWKDERGFTLVELLFVILIMGIVMAIASSSWFGAIESRKVDSATNKFVADLHLAHSKATNRLASQTVALGAGSSEYTVTDAATGAVTTFDLDDCDAEAVANGDCETEDVVVINAAASVEFKADGSAVITGANPIRVESSKDSDKCHEIEINGATSRVQIVPTDCA